MTQHGISLRRPYEGSTTLNIAHRGARAFAPENTMPAFEKARTFGCHMLELDVHMSKDNRLVVHHDDQLTRCTNVRSRFPHRVSYFVSDFTWEEIQLLDAGSWFVEEISLPEVRRQHFLQGLTQQEIALFISSTDIESYASGGVRIPSLEQVLEYAGRSGMLVNIEIKSLPRMYRGITKSVIELVQARGLESQVLVSSFDHEQLLEVRRLSSAIATAVLSSDRLANVGRYLQLLDADAYHPGCYGDYDSVGFGSVTGELEVRAIAEARAHEFAVNVWTCNEPPQMRQLLFIGVTGLISDFPNRVRDVLAAVPSKPDA